MNSTNFNNCIQTAAGLVEAEVSGSGIPILILHGSPGGIDAARSMSRFLDKDKFKTICLSRPGYLNTPLSPVNHSIEAEADLLVGLLDALQIPRTGVLAWSGGGAVAYQLASRHPERVSALVTVAAVSSAWIAPKTPILDRIMFGTKLGNRIIKYISSHSPEHLIEEALKGEGSLRGSELHSLAEQVIADPAQRQLVLEVALTVNVGGARKAGWLNDVENFAAIKDLGLEKIQCPVLLVHGDADTDALPRYSEEAHRRLERSELVVMERGTHLSFYAHPEASEVQESAKRWFLDHV
ncbi:alpha/beta hydrolase fold protein [Mollisia scopiformis]|uniref:Alpha/beta hydrolase fold protein n=1 Tax=Mollisia scopiformis TaxID=149040 RepID=A0A194XBJ3_MOLSC|nr:alpha/beta hydrolase fold protein [Mollisia scopiformis]KUJ17533.1 alpha/beta hydrolase fold protein [Mollisia scopiformis]